MVDGKVDGVVGKSIILFRGKNEQASIEYFPVHVAKLWLSQRSFKPSKL